MSNQPTNVDGFDFIESEVGVETSQVGGDASQNPFGERIDAFQPGNIGDLTQIYKKHRGSSTRFPGGNCILESVLTYMDTEHIQKMIDTVDIVYGQEKISGENDPYRDDIDEIFKNTPLSRYALLSAYMRAYIYLYCKAKEEKKKTKDEIDTGEFTSGSYITPNAYLLGAIRSMTDCDVFRIGIGKNQASIFVTKENNNAYYPGSYANAYYPGSYAVVTNIMKNVQKGNGTGETVKPIEYKGKKIIPLFFKGKHCEPCVPKNDRGMHANIDMSKFRCGRTLNYKKSKWIAGAVLGLGIAVAAVASIFFFPVIPFVAAVSIAVAAGVGGMSASVVAKMSKSRITGNGARIEKLEKNQTEQTEQTEQVETNTPKYKNRPLKKLMHATKRMTKSETREDK